MRLCLCALGLVALAAVRADAQDFIRVGGPGGASPMMLKVTIHSDPNFAGSDLFGSEGPLQGLLGSFFGNDGMFGSMGTGVSPQHGLFDWVQPILSQVDNFMKAASRTDVVKQHVMKADCTCHCKEDVKKFCGKTLSEKPGETLKDVFECLHNNFDKLSGMCVSSLDRYDVLSLCGDEVKAACSDVIPGEGRLHACLLKVPEDQVSPKCHGYLSKDMEEADPSFVEKVERAEEDNAEDDIFPMDLLEKKAEDTKKGSKELLVWTLSGIGAALAVLAAVVVLFKSRSARQVRDRPIGYVPFLT